MKDVCKYSMDKQKEALSDGDLSAEVLSSQQSESHESRSSPGGSPVKSSKEAKDKLSLFIPNVSEKNVLADCPDVGVSRTRYWRTSSSPSVPKSAEVPQKLIKKQARQGKHQNLFRMKSMSRIPTPGVTSGTAAPFFGSKTTPKLQNGLVETCVVVGMHENTGLKVKSHVS